MIDFMFSMFCVNLLMKIVYFVVLLMVMMIFIDDDAL